MIYLGRDLLERIVKTTLVAGTGLMSPFVKGPFPILHIADDAAPKIFGLDHEHRVVRDKQMINFSRFIP